MIEIDEKALKEIQDTLAPFALIGADCEDGKTSFKVNFGVEDDMHHIVTEKDFIRAFQTANKLGSQNLPEFLVSARQRKQDGVPQQTPEVIKVIASEPTSTFPLWLRTMIWFLPIVNTIAFISALILLMAVIL